MNALPSGKPVAIVTAAGRGIGAGIARELHTRGYQLALMSVSERSEGLALELDGLGLRGSVECSGDLERLVGETLARYGRIDAVVANTGHPPKGDLLEIGDDAWGRGHDLVLMPVIRLARLVTPTMLQQGKGAFLNMTTFATLEPSLKFPVSCAYRAAVAAYAKLYADRYAKFNVRMNCLLPGYTDSLDHAAETLASIPMQRVGTVSEVARTAAFLLSDDAGYITGQSLRVDGGLTRHI